MRQFESDPLAAHVPSIAQAYLSASRCQRCVTAFAAMTLLAPLSVHAEAQFPERPIRIIIPSAAGGGPDIGTRLIAAELGKQLGQNVVVDNRPGASGTIGTEAIVRDRLLEMGLEPRGGSPEEFAVFVRKEFAKWSDVAKRANVRIE